ncbi:hypothetical protein BpHYR1_048205 [Brachionus plicatilis]|uniref:Uncharacterized protein n=1 Tax=Brachionus plicatilis TaxID=10195 RepID=A0A3M7QKQ4_BRAPC|nr:hypothetical protein BpHYR1_048205 [Brachionus plicatilis]
MERSCLGDGGTGEPDGSGVELALGLFRPGGLVCLLGLNISFTDFSGVCFAWLLSTLLLIFFFSSLVDITADDCELFTRYSCKDFQIDDENEFDDNLILNFLVQNRHILKQLEFLNSMMENYLLEVLLFLKILIPSRHILNKLEFPSVQFSDA